MSLLEFVFSYQAGLLIIGSISGTNLLKRLFGRHASHTWAKRVLALTGLGIGLLVGLTSEWLPGDLPERATGGGLLGLGAPALWSAFLKRRVDEAVPS